MRSKNSSTRTEVPSPACGGGKARGAAPQPALSIIIPVLNEATTLPALLADLAAQQGLPLEVIVADGGSHDDTLRVAAALGARSVSAARGRAAQMNAGRRAARAPLLLFLHADTRLDAPDLLAEAVRAWRAWDDARIAGHFALAFDRTSPGADLLYRWMEAKTRLDRAGTFNGDQGLLIAAHWFDALGGFDERLPILEDQRIGARISREGRLRLLPGTLRTSARRFDAEGPLRRYALMAVMMGLHAAGAESFFEEAPAVYREQSDAQRLHLLPFARPAWRALRRTGIGGVARLVRHAAGNAWQLAFFLDVVAMRDEATALARYDRWCAGIRAKAETPVP